jgi:response regulator RpfG family c-di-GMP phosphodiesterase
MSEKILFVDDDPHLLAAFERNLRKEFSLEFAIGPREALEHLQKRGPFAVVVADLRMPGMDGTTLLEHFRRLAPDTVRLMLTGNAERQAAIEAINRGQIFRFLAKPCAPDVLVPALRAALQQHQLICAERALLEGTLAKCVHALVEILGLAVPEAHGRGQTLREAIREMAVAHSLAPLWELELAAELSPVGYASLPHEVLRKLHARVPLSFDEQATVDRVPQVGHDLLTGIPRLENVARIVLLQHKNYDGSGFPHIACAGSDIPLGARLLKILGDRLTLEAQGLMGSSARHEMAQRTGCYDQDLFERCFVCFPGLVARMPDGERPPLALNLDELKPGQRLYADVKAAGGLALATRGQRVTSMMIVRLRNLAEIGEVHEPFLIHDESGATAGLAALARH